MADRSDLTYAVIPARGGSKGIHRKNLQLVGDEPLVVRSIKAALGAERIARVFVTTDDTEIADVSRAAGAEVIDRPVEISGDQASSESAVLHALETIRSSEGHLPDVCVLLQCTSPFVQPQDIDATVALIVESGSDSAFTATPSHVFLWRDTPQGAVGVNHDKAGRTRRQDLAPEVAETGGAYAMRVDGFLRAGHRFFGRTGYHLVPTLRAGEIDDEDDLALARLTAPIVDRAPPGGSASGPGRP
jgi:CMP-N-acetylneuraminic acid synthetase